jgi:Mn2+/Fe2+ NRAMP family transporter
MMEALLSSETSVLTRTTLGNIPGEDIRQYEIHLKNMNNTMPSLAASKLHVLVTDYIIVFSTHALFFCFPFVLGPLIIFAASAEMTNKAQ